jgi:large subunit ribosomal protein L25
MELILKAEPREIIGKKVKTLRQAGLIPAVLYGKNFDNLSLTLDKAAFEKVFKEAGSSTLVNLETTGQEKVKVLVHEPQRDPVTDQIIHVDLYKVNMKQEIRTEIPLEFVGTSAAVEDLEGNLITSKDSLDVECLPDKLVSQIEVDITVLKTFDDLIKVGDIIVPEGIKILAEPEEIVAQVTPPRSEEELEEMEQETTADAEKAGIESIEAQAEAEKAQKAEDEEGAGESKENKE